MLLAKEGEYVIIWSRPFPQMSVLHLNAKDVPFSKTPLPDCLSTEEFRP